MNRRLLTSLLFTVFFISSGSTSISAFSLSETWNQSKEWLCRHKKIISAVALSSLFGFSLYRYITRNSLYGYEKKVDNDIKIRFEGEKHSLSALNNRSAQENGIASDSVLLFLHGWNEHRDVRRAQQWAEQMPELPLVSFNFVDGENPSLVRNARGKPTLKIGNFLANLTKANYGQLPDVMRAVLVLKKLHESGVQKVNLLAWCRGSGCAVNMLAVLNDKNGIYDNALQKIGVNQMMREQLIQMIERGKHAISCPMLDLRVPLRVPGADLLVSAVGRYNLFGLHGYKSIEKLGGLHLDAIVHYQRNDEVVKGVYNQQFFSGLQRASTGEVTMLYDEGKHADPTPNLNNNIRAFFLGNEE